MCEIILTLPLGGIRQALPEPNTPVGFWFHHMIGSGRRISGVPGVIRKPFRMST